MKESTSKEKVLKKVRDALVNAMPPPYDGVDLESPVLHPPHTPYPEEAFAASFSEAGGKFVFCQSVHEMATGIQALLEQRNLKMIFCRETFIADLLNELGAPHTGETGKAHECDAAVTACEALVARHGSILFCSRQACGRRGFIVAPLHIVVATSQQLVYDLTDAFKLMHERYPEKLPSMISLVSGPSRTADIEKTLVLGAHGPGELFLFMLDVESVEEDVREKDEAL